MATKLETELRASENQREVFAKAPSALPVPLAVVNDDGKIIASSDGYRQLATRIRTLRSTGETWVSPDTGTRVDEVAVGEGECRARLLLIHETSPKH